MYSFLCVIHYEDLAGFFQSIDPETKLTTRDVVLGIEVSPDEYRYTAEGWLAKRVNPESYQHFHEIASFILEIEDQGKAMLFRMFHDEPEVTMITDVHQFEADQEMERMLQEREDMQEEYDRQAKEREGQLELVDPGIMRFCGFGHLQIEEDDGSTPRLRLEP